MHTNDKLPSKEQELIAIGASIAAGCQPCTEHHFAAAHQAGASEAEISEAVDHALRTRSTATKIMVGVAQRLLRSEDSTEKQQDAITPLHSELISIGAALAVNCTTSLEAHLQTARSAGASDREIRRALGIARAVRNVATEKAEDLVHRRVMQKQSVMHG